MLLPNTSLLDLPIEDYLKDLCSCLNSFHTLGFSSVARSLAVELAGKLLSRFASNQNDLSIAVKSADVCRVLVDSVEHQRLSFQLGLQGLSIPRKPAKTKLQEVKHCLNASHQPNFWRSMFICKLCLQILLCTYIKRATLDIYDCH